MQRFSFLIGFIQLIVVCHATLPKFPERLQELPQFKGKYTGKIVGGEPVDHCANYPYQVSIQRKSLMTGGFSHFCGGSLINSNTVLTAGHCVNGRSASAISVVVGTHKLDSSGREGVRRSASNITVHEKYNSRDVDYDIAIIKLEKSLDMSPDCVTAVRLPKQNQEIQPGSMCYATGWGTTSEGGSTSATLRAVSVPIVTQEECKESYGEEDITPRMLCAGLKDGGKDSCQGDSGGPLTCNGVQMGITSWGYGCARPDFYGVYTRVAHFSDWIQARISN